MKAPSPTLRPWLSSEGQTQPREHSSHRNVDPKTVCVGVGVASPEKVRHGQSCHSAIVRYRHSIRIPVPYVLEYIAIYNTTALALASS